MRVSLLRSLTGLVLVSASVVSGAAGCAAPVDEGGEDGEDVAEIADELVTSGTGTVNTDGVNLRAAPSTSAAVLDVLDRGAQATITGPKKSANGYVWVPVKVGGKAGWLAAKFLSPAPPIALDQAVAFLGREVARRSPGTKLSISVHVFGGSERAELASEVPRPSASSAKAVWAAAALSRNAASSLEDEARPVFVSSDNDQAGRLIDLAGGIDAVNTFYTKVGMTKSGMLTWSTGGVSRVDGDEPAPLGSGVNYMTARDAVRFLDRLETGQILGAAKREKLLSWMTLAPNAGTGGWLTARLPEPARSRAAHKAGWLPPPLSSRALNEIGIVPTKSGKRYSVAIFTRDGADWGGKQAPFVEYASCVIYRAVEAARGLACD